MEDKTTAQARMLANRLRKRFRHLKKWAQRTGAGAFRLYDRDIPEIPLVLDFYGDCAVPSDAAVCGALYARPYEKDESDEEKWLCAMKDSAADALEIAPEHVFFKQRKRQRGPSQYGKTGDIQFTKIISEGSLPANKLAFKVNLSDYLDTGLFPDRRLLRSIVRSEALNKKVLNLFSYTGSFSVYAAAGGAVSTDSVDLSNTYLNWAQENFSLNGFSAERGRMSAHRLIRADVLDYIEKAAAAKMQWDIIVVDPPAFSNSKKMTDNFDLNRDLQKMLNQCLPLLASGGKMFASVNVKRGAPSAQELEAGLRSASNVRITDISGKIEDEDFKGKKMPKAFLVTAGERK